VHSKHEAFNGKMPHLESEDENIKRKMLLNQTWD
jgi:hypothetical protein